MFLHTLFFPNYAPLTDFSVLETYMFSSASLKVEEKIMIKEETKKEEKEEEIKKEEKKEEEKETKKEEKKIKIESYIQKNGIYVKNVQDEPFWLVFIAIYGVTEYHRNKYNYGKVEIKEKQKIAEKMMTPDFGKKMKWKWTKIQRIEMISDLTNCPKMPLAIFNALATHYECIFILVDVQKKVYIKYGIHDEKDKENTYLLFINSRSREKERENMKVKKEYRLLDQPSNSLLQQIQEEYFALEHFERPLKAISNYKKIELDVISAKIGVPDIDIREKASKQEVYDRLRLFLSDSVLLQE